MSQSGCKGRSSTRSTYLRDGEWVISFGDHERHVFRARPRSRSVSASAGSCPDHSGWRLDRGSAPPLVAAPTVSFSGQKRCRRIHRGHFRGFVGRMADRPLQEVRARPATLDRHAGDPHRRPLQIHAQPDVLDDGPSLRGCCPHSRERVGAPCQPALRVGHLYSLPSDTKRSTWSASSAAAIAGTSNGCVAGYEARQVQGKPGPWRGSRRPCWARSGPTIEASRSFIAYYDLARRCGSVRSGEVGRIPGRWSC